MRCAGEILRAFVALRFPAELFCFFGIKANIGSVGKGDQKTTKNHGPARCHDLLRDGRFLFRRRLFRWTMRPGAFWLPLTAALRKCLPLTARPLMVMPSAVRTRRRAPVTLSPLWRKCCRSGAHQDGHIWYGSQNFDKRAYSPGADAVSKFEETDFTPETVTLKRALSAR